MFVYLFGNSTQFILLLEKARGSLRDIIHPDTSEKKALLNDVLSKLTQQDIVKDIFTALSFVHSRSYDVNNNISHRDIKPENILIVRHKRSGMYSIKFTDFDSAKELEVDDKVQITSAGNIFTPLYKDPNLDKKQARKMLIGSNVYQPSDVYAAALVAYEVLGNGDHVFQGKEETIDHLTTLLNMKHNNRINLMESKIDELAKNLIFTMTQPKPEDRITMKEAEQSPFFSDDAYHLQVLNAVNDAIIDLDDSDESNAIKDALNETFFMVFQTEWKKLPFVIPEILQCSKYSNNLISYFRYCRNMIVHAEQHKDVLRKHLRIHPTPANLWRETLKSTPTSSVHLHWLGKVHLKGLSITEAFPELCCKAYEEQMKLKKKELEAVWESIQSCVKDKHNDDAHYVDKDAEMIEAFDVTHKQMVQLLDKTEVKFRAYKEKMKKMEKELQRAKSKVTNLKRNKRPTADIREAENQLQDLQRKVDADMNFKWMLDVRNVIRNPETLHQS